jgi:hypothetical protein
MEKRIKITLSVLMLLCLLDMPYGYFQLVRWAALIGFSFLAIQANKRNKTNDLIIFISLAILFQPLVKIALGRTIWNLVDLIVGGWLLVSIYLNQKK